MKKHPYSVVLVIFLGVAGLLYCSAGELTFEQAVAKLHKLGYKTKMDKTLFPKRPPGAGYLLLKREAPLNYDGKHKKVWDHSPSYGVGPWKDVPEKTKKKVERYFLDHKDFKQLYATVRKASTMDCYRGWPGGGYSGEPFLTNNRAYTRFIADRTRFLLQRGKVGDAVDCELVGFRLTEAAELKKHLVIDRLIHLACVAYRSDGLARILPHPISREDCRRLLAATNDVRIELVSDDVIQYRLLFYMICIHNAVLDAKGSAKQRDKAWELAEFCLGINNTREELAELPLKKLPAAEYEKRRGELRAELKRRLQPIERLKKAFMNLSKRERDALSATQLSQLTTMHQVIREPSYTKRIKLIDAMPKPKVKEEDDPGCFFDKASEWRGMTMREFSGNAMLEQMKLAIACKLYQKDIGSYPKSLELLVPKYIKSIPNDPFTDKPMKYRREKGEAIIYSVGANLKDDGGRKHWWSDKEGSDVIFRLAAPK